MKVWIVLLHFFGLVCELSVNGSSLVPVSLLKATSNDSENENSDYETHGDLKPKRVKNDIFLVDSVESLIKYLYTESLERGIEADIAQCKTAVNIYLDSKTLPNISESGIPFNRRELLDLLIYTVKNPGNVKKYIAKDKKKKSSLLKSIFNKSDSPSSTRSSSLKSSSSSHLSGPTVTRVYDHSSDSETSSAVKLSKDRTIHSEIEKSSERRSSDPKSGKTSEDTQRKGDGSSGMIPEEKLSSYYGMNADMDELVIDSEAGRVEHQIIYSPDEFKLELDSDESILKLKKILSSDFKLVPWRTLISMILHIPKRRNEFQYCEKSCKKISEVMGKVLFHYLINLCKLKSAATEYNLKNCFDKKNKYIRIITGCTKIKKMLKKYTKLYFKLRFDFVDSIILTTQCSIAKTSHLSTSTPILTPPNQNYNYEKCTLGQYYLMLDYLAFVEYVNIGLGKTKSKLDVILRDKCTPKCSITCFKCGSSKLCSYLRKVHEELSNDLNKLANHETILEKKISFCKNYLILNNEFSQYIPETAQYVTEEGVRKDVESTQGILTVQYPKYAKADPNSLIILESKFFQTVSLETKAKSDFEGEQSESNEKHDDKHSKIGATNKGYTDTEDKSQGSTSKNIYSYASEWI
ncbi:hypothetical protein FG379_002915 [Cryptosporidium bovis]|uniref:uncharacterized protein n=1 Tax=Cryptosporidium bovis TaxID=310047 RepID=UPI00351AA009|nr:hypothetical protein FG379_002915 [Cryptosporidium bovis]